MAGQKLTDKSAIDHLGTGDLFMTVDVSDTTGSTAGTSKKMDAKYSLITDKISISNADFLAMRTGSGASDFKTLVAAPGTGFMIIPVNLTMLVTYAAPTQTGLINLFVGYNPTTVSYYAIQARNFMRNITTSSTFIYPTIPAINGSHSASIENQPLVMYSSNPFSGGFSADAYITYKIQKIL
tara:strand:- start:154 stop:699 length:546 start_codon:yes stop_codon:yes gene_type:complete